MPLGIALFLLLFSRLLLELQVHVTPKHEMTMNDEKPSDVES